MSVKLKMSFHSLLAFREGVWAEWITIKQGMQTFAVFFFSLGEDGVTVIKVKFSFFFCRSFVTPACRLLLSAFSSSLQSSFFAFCHSSAAFQIPLSLYLLQERMDPFLIRQEEPLCNLDYLCLTNKVSVFRCNFFHTKIKGVSSLKIRF